MSEMQFNEEQTSTRYIKTVESKGITAFLIKKGIAKDIKQANVILIGVIIVMSIIFFISISGGNSSGDTYDPVLDDPSLTI
jgi:SNF family Na+-dependent transporter